MQWFCSSITRFQALFQRLNTFLESLYVHVGKRTKRAVARIVLDKLGWDSTLTDDFETCKTAIAECVTLSHKDKSKLL